MTHGTVQDAAWVSAATALATVAKVAGGEEAAQGILEEHLRAGRFSARADLVVDQVDFGPIPSRPPSQVSGVTTQIRVGLIRLGPAFWSHSTSTYGDTLWKWEEGVFAWVHPPPPVLKHNPKTGGWSSKERMRMVAFGVEFLQAEIAELIAELAAVDASVKKTLKATAERVSRERSFKTTWNWKVIAELTASAKAGNLERLIGAFEKRGAQARLEAAIKAKFISSLDDHPSDSTIRRKARELIAMNDASSSGRGDPI